MIKGVSRLSKFLASSSLGERQRMFLRKEKLKGPGSLEDEGNEIDKESD